MIFSFRSIDIIVVLILFNPLSSFLCGGPVCSDANNRKACHIYIASVVVSSICFRICM